MQSGLFVLYFYCSEFWGNCRPTRSGVGISFEIHAQAAGWLRPANIQGVDFLIAGVAGKDRRAVRRDVDLMGAPVRHTMVFQAGDGLYLAVGKPDSHDLWFGVSRREIEILAVWRDHPVLDVT